MLLALTFFALAGVAPPPPPPALPEAAPAAAAAAAACECAAAALETPSLPFELFPLFLFPRGGTTHRLQTLI